MTTPPFNRTPAYNVENAKFYSGTKRTDTAKNNGGVTIPATVGSVDISGPAIGSGKLRVIGGMFFTAQGSSIAITVTLNPVGLVFGRGLVAVANSASFYNSTAVPITLGPGETLTCANTGAAAATLWYTYYDIPDNNRTLVRGSCSSAALVTVIPAADPGFYNKWLMANTATISASIARISLFIFNDDTVAAQLNEYYGATLLSRSAPAAANAQISPVATFWDLVVTNTPLQFAANVGITTRNINFMGCYETYEGVGNLA